jgi:hypothetical protein
LQVKDEEKSMEGKEPTMLAMATAIVADLWKSYAL